MTTPIIVFGNPKSGGGDAQRLFDKINGLDGAHIFRLPEEKDNWKTLPGEILDNPQLRILVAGGDGTVNWVLSILEEYSPTYHPPIVIYPCGTGNDLSNSFGWGRHADLKGKDQFINFLQEIRSDLELINFDIWSVSITPTGPPFAHSDNSPLIQSEIPPIIQKRMLNYFSVGTDAKIALDFEQYRSAHSVKSQFMSKALYFPMGMKNLFGAKKLGKYADIDITDAQNNPTPLKFKKGEKTAVCQAITSIYGGQDLWTNDSVRKMDDGLFEVILLGGSISLGFNQIGIHSGRCVMQGKHFSLNTRQPCYVQIDGEAMFLYYPATVTLTQSGKYPIFKRSSNK